MASTRLASRATATNLIRPTMIALFARDFLACQFGLDVEYREYG